MLYYFFIKDLLKFLETLRSYHNLNADISQYCLPPLNNNKVLLLKIKQHDTSIKTINLLKDSINFISLKTVYKGNLLVKYVSRLFTLNCLTLKTPRKPASENAVCLCRLLNILANFSNLFLHTGKQCGPRSDCS